MKILPLALLLLTLGSAVRADDKTPAPPWSPAVHGLRARIFTAPSTEPELDKTFDVLIDFQETGLDTSLGFEHRSLTVRFSRPEFQVTVTGAKDAPVAVTKKTEPQDYASVATWDLILPPGGDLSFRIGMGGSSPHVVPGQPPKGHLLSFDPLNEWLIPDTDGPYHLAITFQVSDSGGPVPTADATPAPADTSTSTTTAGTAAASDPPYRGWTGTLVLPPIEIPEK